MCDSLPASVSVCLLLKSGSRRRVTRLAISVFASRAPKPSALPRDWAASPWAHSHRGRIRRRAPQYSPSACALPSLTNARRLFASALRHLHEHPRRQCRRARQRLTPKTPRAPTAPRIERGQKFAPEELCRRKHGDRRSAVNHIAFMHRDSHGYTRRAPIATAPSLSPRNLPNLPHRDATIAFAVSIRAPGDC